MKEVITKELVKYSGQTFSKASEAYEYIYDMLVKVYNVGVKDTIDNVESVIAVGFVRDRQELTDIIKKALLK